MGHKEGKGKKFYFYFKEDGYVESYVDFFYITNNCMKDFL